MKRTVISSLVLVVAFLAAGPAAQTPAGALPTIDQVLDKYIAALGGRAAMEKVTSKVAKGVMEIPEANLSGTMTMSMKAPDKSLVVIELPGMGLAREGTDGTVAWSEDPQQGLRDKTGAEAADSKRGAAFNGELRLKSLYKTLVVSAKEKVGTRDAYVVTATPDLGAVTKMYFDVETGLLVRQSATRDSAMGPVDVDVYLEDYRDVGGIKEAFVIRQVTAQFSLIARMTEIKHNVPLDDAIFKKPGL
jgi:zinc protease